MKAPALAAFSACSTTGWRPPRISKAVAVVEQRAHIALLGGKLGEACLAVELGQRRRDLAERLLLGGDRRRQLGEHLLLDGERPVGRGDDAALGLDQLEW